jgi:hypothetical protein
MKATQSSMYSLCMLVSSNTCSNILPVRSTLRQLHPGEGESARMDGGRSVPVAANARDWQRGRGSIPTAHHGTSGGRRQPHLQQPSVRQVQRQYPSQQTPQGGDRQSQSQQPQKQTKKQSTMAAVAAAQTALAPWRSERPEYSQQRQGPQAGGEPQHPSQQQQPQQTPQQQRQQRPAKPQKAWIKDGRVYNYAKDGATLVRLFPRQIAACLFFQAKKKRRAGMTNDMPFVFLDLLLTVFFAHVQTLQYRVSSIVMRLFISLAMYLKIAEHISKTLNHASHSVAH